MRRISARFSGLSPFGAQYNDDRLIDRISHCPLKLRQGTSRRTIALRSTRHIA